MRREHQQNFCPLNQKESPKAVSIRYALIRPSNMALMKIKGMYTVESHADDNETGCLLLQEQEHESYIHIK